MNDISRTEKDTLGKKNSMSKGMKRRINEIFCREGK